MTRLYIKADDRVLFDAEVTDYNPPPYLPTNPAPVPYGKLPKEVRDVLDTAMAAMLEKATGTRWVKA